MGGPMGEVNPSYTLGSSIPVLRMLDEENSKRFYVGFLGYEIEWEHRFRDSPESPLYMQLRQGASVLHLNGHADQDAPTAEVRVPVRHLGAFCQTLRERSGNQVMDAVDPRNEGRSTDLNLYDPSGNLIVFWSPSDS